MSIDFGSNYDYWLQQLSLSTPESLSYLNQVQDSKEAWNLAFNLLDNQVNKIFLLAVFIDFFDIEFNS
jgi:hypothetical protein